MRRDDGRKKKRNDRDALISEKYNAITIYGNNTVPSCQVDLLYVANWKAERSMQETEKQLQVILYNMI